MINNLLYGIETFLTNFTGRHLSFVVMMLFVFLIAYYIHRYLLGKKFKLRIAEANTQKFKKFNLETEYMVKKKMLKNSYLILYLSAAVLIVLRDNINLLMPVLSGLVLVFIFAIRELLNNFILGVFFKSSLTTTVSEGMIFSFADAPNNVLEVVKINLFKTIIKNKTSGRLESIENNELNKRQLIHRPLREQDYISFRYIVGSAFNIEGYIFNLRKDLDEMVRSSKIEFEAIKNSIYLIKSRFGHSPHLKPFYKIDLKYLNKNEIEINIELTIYNYDNSNYLKDFLKFKPNLKEPYVKLKKVAHS